MVRGSAKNGQGKVVSSMSALGPRSSMAPIAESPGDGPTRRGTRGQLSANAKAVGTELPKGAPVRKRNLDSSLAEVPLEPVGVPAIGERVTPMVLVESSDGVQAVLAAIAMQEALSISLPVAAHTTNPCTLPLQEEVVNETDTNGNEQMCKQRPSQPTPSHIIAHLRIAMQCSATHLTRPSTRPSTHTTCNTTGTRNGRRWSLREVATFHARWQTPRVALTTQEGVPPPSRVPSRKMPSAMRCLQH